MHYSTYQEIFWASSTSWALRTSLTQRTSWALFWIFLDVQQSYDAFSFVNLCIIFRIIWFIQRLIFEIIIFNIIFFRIVVFIFHEFNAIEFIVRVIFMIFFVTFMIVRITFMIFEFFMFFFSDIFERIYIDNIC